MTKRTEETIKQINITNQAFKMLDDLSTIACDSLNLSKDLVNTLSLNECIDVLSKCDNIPVSIKNNLVIRTKKLESELINKGKYYANTNQLEDVF